MQASGLRPISFFSADRLYLASDAVGANRFGWPGGSIWVNTSEVLWPPETAKEPNVLGHVGPWKLGTLLANVLSILGTDVLGKATFFCNPGCRQQC